MSSLLTKITSSAASAYQQVELALLTRNGKAGEVARAAKATFMTFSTIYSNVRANGSKMLKDNFGRIIEATVNPLLLGAVGDRAMVIARLASPWGYIPHIVAAGCIEHKVRTDPFGAQTISSRTATSLSIGILLSTFTPAQNTVLSGLSIALQRWVYPRPWAYHGLPMDLLFEAGRNEWKMITSNGCVYLIGGAPGVTMGHLLFEGLSSLTDFKPIFGSLFEENYALLEAQLFVKYLEKKGGSMVVITTITTIVRQYLELAPLDPTEEQQQERVVVLCDTTASAAATSMPHQKTD